MCLMGRFFCSRPIAISIISFMDTISVDPRFSGCKCKNTYLSKHDCFSQQSK